MTEIGLCLYSAVIYTNTKEYYNCVVKNISKNTGFTPPTILWIMSDVNANDVNTYVNFPKPASGTWPNIIFSTQDNNEAYFTYFDTVGIKVYLQGLPSEAAVSDLIKLGLDRYSNHSCIAGWGLDIEWLQFTKYADGRSVTNTEAKAWIDQIKTYNSNYKLQLTHWLHEKMPTTHYSDVIYIDDGQGAGSLTNLVNAFNTFASNFPDGTSAVDIGYATDQSWWQNLTNPAADISKAMKDSVPSIVGSYWWGETMKTIYPTCTTQCNNPTFDFTLT